ncbi:MAG: ankyrin repeat domain-containing protein [Candidatus Thorarchaeota archaeon]
MSLSPASLDVYTLSDSKVHEIHSGMFNDITDHVMKGRFAELEKFLEKGGDANQTNNEGNTLLHFAAMYEQNIIAELLLKHGGNPYKTNNEGLTARDFAEGTKNEKMVKLFDDHFKHAASYLEKRSSKKSTCFLL